MTRGKMHNCVAICLCVPSDSTPRIQEAHPLISHILSRIAGNALVAAPDAFSPASGTTA
jgi:hypothetical protein